MLEEFKQHVEQARKGDWMALGFALDEHSDLVEAADKFFDFSISKDFIKLAELSLKQFEVLKAKLQKDREEEENSYIFMLDRIISKLKKKIDVYYMEND